MQRPRLSIRECTDSQDWRPDVWNAIVQQGMERFCTSCRDSAKTGRGSTASAVPTKHRCAFCNLTPVPAPGFCSTCLATERLACAKCDVGRKIETKAFDKFSPQEIFQKKYGNLKLQAGGYRRSELRRARCLQCITAAQAHPKHTAPLGQCRTCQKLFCSSNLREYSEITRTGICRTCNAPTRAAKTCGQCGAILASQFATPTLEVKTGGPAKAADARRRSDVCCSTRRQLLWHHTLRNRSNYCTTQHL